MESTVAKSLKFFFTRLMPVISLTLLITGNSMAKGYKNRYRINKSHDSLSNAFDSVFAQLDGKNNTASNAKFVSLKSSRGNDINQYIQSFVDTLDTSKQQQFYGTQSWEVPRNSLVAHASKEIITSVGLSDHDFQAALNRFKENRDFGQLAVQHVIDLLDVELNIVRHLIAGNTGATVQAALDERNGLLQRTIPLAVTMYDTILSQAMYHNKLNETLSRRTMNGKRLPKALTTYDQKMFLSTLENNIEQYQHIMRDMQHNLNNYAPGTSRTNIPDGGAHAMHEYLAART